MLVVATAGHVDHGKSTLVRTLTGMEPDRLAEERRRGLTIELGYVWTTLGPPGAGAAQVAFVDVPGHQRFIGTMLAGLGPVSSVLLVVAADEGWSAQTTEHLDAIDALAIERGIAVVTRSDLADPAPVAADVELRLSSSSLRGAPVLHVSARTGWGLDRLRSALLDLARWAPSPAPTTSLWADRAFTSPGSGSVVTGTLSGGRLSVGERVWLSGATGTTPVTVRRLQALGRDRDTVAGPARVALNLRAVRLAPWLRGSRVTADPVNPTGVADVRVAAKGPLPRTARVHLGTAVRSATVRPLAGDLVRLTFVEPLPLRTGDRGLLRDPARHLVLGGLEVLDPDPPGLRRRGDATRRAAELRGAGGILRFGDLLVEEEAWQRWGRDLRAAATDPLPVSRALEFTGMPHAELLPELARSVGLGVQEHLVGAQGPVWEEPLGTLEDLWSRAPFRSPTRPEVAASGLTPGALNDAAGAGRVLRLPGGVLLPGDAAGRAVAVLTSLPQPFTTSQAREALDTTRRVAVALLEHLDLLGHTRRSSEDLRRVVRPPSGTAPGAPG